MTNGALWKGRFVSGFARGEGGGVSGVRCQVSGVRKRRTSNAQRRMEILNVKYNEKLWQSRQRPPIRRLIFINCQLLVRT